MPDNSANVVLTATADGVLRAADAVKRKFQELGQEGGKAGGKMFEHLGNSFLKAAALTQAVKGVAEALNTAASNAAKLSKEVGGRALSAEISGQRLGLKSNQTASILAATGPRSAEERTGFLSSLANAKGPGGRPLDAGTALEASRIFGQNSMEGSEIIEALGKRGRGGLAGLAAESNRRLGGFGSLANSELDARSGDSAAALRAADTASSAGFSERERQAKLEALRAENPGAFAVGDAIGTATEHLGGKAVIEAGRRAGLSAGDFTVVGLLSKIAGSVAPRLNASANGP